MTTAPAYGEVGYNHYVAIGRKFESPAKFLPPASATVEMSFTVVDPLVSSWWENKLSDTLLTEAISHFLTSATSLPPNYQLSSSDNHRLTTHPLIFVVSVRHYASVSATYM